MEIDEEKTAFNARAKASMQAMLRAKSWEEKVRSIERMRVVDRLAKEAMRKTLAERKKADAALPESADTGIPAAPEGRAFGVVQSRS